MHILKNVFFLYIRSFKQNQVLLQYHQNRLSYSLQFILISTESTKKINFFIFSLVKLIIVTNQVHTILDSLIDILDVDVAWFLFIINLKFIIQSQFLLSNLSKSISGQSSTSCFSKICKSTILY